MRVDGGTPTTDASRGRRRGAQCAPRPASAWGERFGVEHSTPLGASTALDSRRALSLLRHHRPARAGYQKNHYACLSHRGVSHVLAQSAEHFS